MKPRPIIVYLHGAAVAIGMVSAAKMAQKLKMIKASEQTRIVQLIKDFKLPTSIKNLRLSKKKILFAMQRDKKKKAGKLRFVLPTRVGKTVVKEGVSPSVISSII